MAEFGQLVCRYETYLEIFELATYPPTLLRYQRREVVYQPDHHQQSARQHDGRSSQHCPFRFRFLYSVQITFEIVPNERTKFLSAITWFADLQYCCTCTKSRDTYSSERERERDRSTYHRSLFITHLPSSRRQGTSFLERPSHSHNDDEG